MIASTTNSNRQYLVYEHLQTKTSHIEKEVCTLHRTDTKPTLGIDLGNMSNKNPKFGSLRGWAHRYWSGLFEMWKPRLLGFDGHCHYIGCGQAATNAERQEMGWLWEIERCRKIGQWMAADSIIVRKRINHYQSVSISWLVGNQSMMLSGFIVWSFQTNVCIRKVNQSYERIRYAQRPATVPGTLGLLAGRRFNWSRSLVAVYHGMSLFS